jgi:hypothetical protein
MDVQALVGIDFGNWVAKIDGDKHTPKIKQLPSKQN